MLKIRTRIFETNSSSSDYYNDDDYDTKITSMTGTQIVNIIFEFKAGLTESQIFDIIDMLKTEINSGNDKILEPIYDFIYDENYIDHVDHNKTNTGICFEIYVNNHISGWEGKYYPQTLESPEEFPEPIFEEYTDLPGRNNDFEGKTKLKSDILKNLHDFNYTNIVNIIDIYGDDVRNWEYK